MPSRIEYTIALVEFANHRRVWINLEERRRAPKGQVCLSKGPYKSEAIEKTWRPPGSSFQGEEIDQVESPFSRRSNLEIRVDRN